MDGTMVYTKTASEKLRDGDLVWKDNVPFESIDEKLVMQLRDREFTYEVYLKWCKVMDTFPTFWNAVLVDKEGVMYGFVAGTWNPLEKELEVKRVSAHPDLFTIEGGFMFEMDKHIREIGKILGVVHIYCVTKFWKTFLRKMPDTLRESKVKILEVI